jgi:O-acetylhomoserine (thiol)-lyase
MLPYACRPIEHGADILVYSATKYIGGHGAALGGLIIDAGRFDWERHASRFPLLTEPDDAYGGVVWTEAGKELESSLGRSSYLLKLRETLLRDLGPCLSPFNAFLLIQGLETLPLRTRAHSENALAVTRFLREHPKVSRVVHPSLSTGAEADRVARYLRGGYGPLVLFDLAGGMEAGLRLMESLRLFSHVTNIGDARSYAFHPASVRHAGNKAKRLAPGVTPGGVRLSIGLEQPDDLIADLAQALELA